jgi:hypothetical protein
MQALVFLYGQKCPCCISSLLSPTRGGHSPQSSPSSSLSSPIRLGELDLVFPSSNLIWHTSGAVLPHLPSSAAVPQSLPSVRLGERRGARRTRVRRWRTCARLGDGAGRARGRPGGYHRQTHATAQGRPGVRRRRTCAGPSDKA